MHCGFILLVVKFVFIKLGLCVMMKLFIFLSELRPDIPSKVCFVNFSDRESVLTSLHLTNTIFIDRALIVARSRYGENSN